MLKPGAGQESGWVAPRHLRRKATCVLASLRAQGPPSVGLRPPRRPNERARLLRVRERFSVRVRERFSVRVRERFSVRVRERFSVRVRERFSVRVRERFSVRFETPTSRRKVTTTCEPNAATEYGSRRPPSRQAAKSSGRPSEAWVQSGYMGDEMDRAHG